MWSDTSVKLAFDDFASVVPFGYADFKNGVYNIGGVAKLVTDLWRQDVSWASWNPAADITPGVGLTGGGIGKGPVSTVFLFNALNIIAGGGFTAIAEYSVQPGAGNMTMEITDLPGYTQGWSYRNSPSAGVQYIEDYAHVSSPHIPSVSGENKAAITFTPAQLSYFATNTPLSQTTAPIQANAAANALGLSCVAGIIEKITFFKPFLDTNHLGHI